jgi:oligoendopeptidase F
MKFNEFPYTRPDFEAYKQSFNEMLKSFSSALDAAEQRSYFRKINELRQAVDSMSTLASIRHSIDTNDAFYKEENDYWDEYKPLGSLTLQRDIK